MSSERPVPAVDDYSYDFWHGGAEGRLVLKRCRGCGRLLHPPGPICPSCYSRSLESAPVSGRASLYSFTVVRKPWIPGYEPPYVVARVVLDEQDDLHLVTNVVDCAPGDLSLGMPLEVCFEERSDVFVPLFRPAAR